MAFDILLRDGAAGLRLRLGGVQAGDTWLPSWPPVACSAGAGAVRLAELRRGAEETVEADEETEDASESVVAVPVVATVDVGEESRRQAEAQAQAKAEGQLRAQKQAQAKAEAQAKAQARERDRERAQALEVEQARARAQATLDAVDGERSTFEHNYAWATMARSVSTYPLCVPDQN